MFHQSTNADERLAHCRHWLARLVVCFNLGAHELLRGPLRPRRQDRKAHNAPGRYPQADKVGSPLPCNAACDASSAARSDNRAANQSASVPRLQSFPNVLYELRSCSSTWELSATILQCTDAWAARTTRRPATLQLCVRCTSRQHDRRLQQLHRDRELSVALPARAAF